MEAPVEPLLEALFHLAFSGEARVYAPDILGEMDTNQRQTPESLLELLKKWEVVSLEDVHTGEIRDTTVDLSFNRSTCTALTIFLFCTGDPNNQRAFTPYYLALGSQVFNEATGEFRGVSRKFYMNLSHEPITLDGVYQQLTFLTDSTGIMKPAYFENYDPDKAGSFRAWLLNSMTSEKHPKLRFRLHFDNARQKLSLQLTPNNEA
jgi:hypothetical protein